MNQTFGKSIARPATPQSTKPGFSSLGLADSAQIVSSNMLVVTVVVMYMWLVVYAVPIQRPFSGLFSDNKELEGWAPLWVPFLVAIVLAILASLASTRIGTHSTAKLVVTGVLTVLTSATAVSLTKNFGYVYFLEPDRLPSFVLNLPRAFGFHSVKGPLDMHYSAPQLWLTSAIPLTVNFVCKKSAGFIVRS